MHPIQLLYKSRTILRIVGERRRDSTAVRPSSQQRRQRMPRGQRARSPSVSCPASASASSAGPSGQRDSRPQSAAEQQD
jgi:hypothetical protein